MPTRRSLAKNMLIIVAVSVAVEIIQGVFALGASDIDDVILNGLGGLLGILVYRLLLSILRTRARVRTVIAVVSIVAVPVFAYLLFVIRLRM